MTSVFRQVTSQEWLQQIFEIRIILKISTQKKQKIPSLIKNINRRFEVGWNDMKSAWESSLMPQKLGTLQRNNTRTMVYILSCLLSRKVRVSGKSTCPQS